MQCIMCHVTNPLISDNKHCYLLFASELPQVMKNVDDVSYSSGCFFNLRGQVDASHSNNLKNNNTEQSLKEWYFFF